MCLFLFFFKQKTAYEMRISDWSSDVCSSDLQKTSGNDGFYDLASTIASPKSDLKEMRAINTTTWQITDNVQLKNIASYAHLHTESGNDIFGTQFRYKLTVPGVANLPLGGLGAIPVLGPVLSNLGLKIGRDACRERVCKYV